MDLFKDKTEALPDWRDYPSSVNPPRYPDSRPFMLAPSERNDMNVQPADRPRVGHKV